MADFEIICPECGAIVVPNRKKFDSNSGIRTYLNKRTPQIQKLIRQLHADLIKLLPSEDSDKLYIFLKVNQDISNEVLKYCIEQYIANTYWIEGKGYSYLSAIIKNRDKNNEKMIEYEKKIYGTMPPVKEI